MCKQDDLHSTTNMGFQCFIHTGRATHLRCLFCCCYSFRLISVLCFSFVHIYVTIAVSASAAAAAAAADVVCWIYLVENQPSDVTVSFEDLVHTLTHIAQHSTAQYRILVHEVLEVNYFHGWFCFFFFHTKRKLKPEDKTKIRTLIV